jgi:hypothetical protein
MLRILDSRLEYGFLTSDFPNKSLYAFPMSSP